MSQVKTINKEKPVEEIVIPERMLFLSKIQKIIKRKTGGYIPQGKRHQSRMCPLSIAFDRPIVIGYFIPGLTRDEKHLMSQFRLRFDRREFPELELSEGDQRTKDQLKADAIPIEAIIGEKQP